jgi:hypothetical protein
VADKQAASAEQIFGHLPGSIFAVLSSPAKHSYSKLIVSIWREYYSEGRIGVQRKDEIVSFISDELLKHAEYEDLLEGLDTVSISQNPYNVYRRLIDAGWLVESTQGYVPVVDIAPSVNMLLETLSNIESGEAVSFTGQIGSIASMIEGLERNPLERASTLATAAKTARSFQIHVSAVVNSLRNYERTLLSLPDPNQIFARFFNEFVERVLIADYRALKRGNNPFRHRGHVIALIGSMELDENKTSALRQGYIEQGLARDENEAHSKVRQHLAQVERAFDLASDQLDEIDTFRLRLERRINRAMSYANRIDTSNPARISGLIHKVGRKVGDWDSDVPVLSDLVDPCRAWGPQFLARPRMSRKLPEAIPLRVEVRDPIITAYDQAKVAYLKRMIITPAKIAGFLAERIGERSEIRAEELAISNVEEALIFQKLRQLPLIENRALNALYELTLHPGKLIETEWSTCQDFTIVRKDRTAKVAKHAV